MIKTISLMFIVVLVIYLYRQLSTTLKGVVCNCCEIKSPVMIEDKRHLCPRCYITHKRLNSSMGEIQEEFNDRFNKGQISNQD